MAFTIAIDELGIGNDKVAYVTLPANKNTVIDAMDKAKIFDCETISASRSNSGEAYFKIKDIA